MALSQRTRCDGILLGWPALLTTSVDSENESFKSLVPDENGRAPCPHQHLVVHVDWDALEGVKAFGSLTDPQNLDVSV